MSTGLLKRVLFLDAYFEPEKTAYTHLENDLISGLIKNGFEITVICPQPTRGVDDSVYKKFSVFESHSNGALIIKRFKCPREGKNSLIRAFRYFLAFQRTYKLAKKDYNFDLIFCNSTPPIQGLLARKTKKYFQKKQKRNVPFIYNLQDVFPDSLVSLGMTKKGSIIWRIGRKIEKKTYLSADTIITISSRFERNLIEKGVSKDKIIVVPNWVNTKEVHYVNRKNNFLYDKYDIDRNLFYFSYCGNIGFSQNFDMLIDCAKDLCLKNSRVGFIIVGDGSAAEHVKNRIRNENINNITVIPFQDYKHISCVFSLGDVGLIISKKGVGSNSIPSKTWSYLAAERPILCSFDQDSELGDLIDSSSCGILCSPDNSEEFKRAINLFVEEKSLAEMGKKGKLFLDTYLDKDKCVGMYISVFKDKLNNE